MRVVSAIVLSATLAACGSTHTNPNGFPCGGNDECDSGLCDTAGKAVCRAACEDALGCDLDEACTYRPDLATHVAACQSADLTQYRAPRSCESDGQCQSHLCLDGACAELCGTCGRDRRCESRTIARLGNEETVGVCVWRLTGTDLELSNITVSAGPSAELFFDVPAGTASATVILIDEPDIDGHRVGFHTLVAPDGSVLVDRAAGIDTNRLGQPQVGALAVLVPNTDAAAGALQVGQYRLQVGLFETSDFITYTPVAGVIERTAVALEPQRERGGVLDVNLLFSEGTGLTNDSAAGASAQAAFLAGFIPTLHGLLRDAARAGVGLILTGAVGSAHDIVSGSAEVNEILSAHAHPGRREASLNVVLVDQILFSGRSINGFAAGSPVAPGVYGNSASGIVARVLSTPQRTARLVAHEIGHALGLWHTSEGASGPYDPVADTPECSALPCPDEDNLMYAQFSASEPSLTLSPSQARIVGASPWLYEIEAAELSLDAQRVYDMTLARFASGDTSAFASLEVGSCGGAGAPERVHRYHEISPVAGDIELTLTATGFDPVLYVRRGTPFSEAWEVACEIGSADQPLSVVFSSPTADDYFIVVDGHAGAGGDFVLEARRL